MISNWHCQQNCLQSQSCTTYNWHGSGDRECTLIAGIEGPNKLLSAPHWIAGVSDCNSIFDYTSQSRFLALPCDRLLISCLIESCPQNGFYLGRVADGVCDDGTNNEECGFDGGDCCDPRSTVDSCTDCRCIQCLPGLPCIGEGMSSDPDKGTCDSGGDFVCNAFNNKEQCNFDDGDCCLYNANCGEDCSNLALCACHESNVLYCSVDLPFGN